MFLLGVSITVAEFPTTFPYLGTIGILNSLELPLLGWLPLLLGYNLLFGAYRLFSARHRAWFERYEKRLRYEARETMLWMVEVVGFLLLGDALRRLEVFNLLG